MDKQPAGVANQQNLMDRIYRLLLHEASDASCKAMERLRSLREHFPDALTVEDIAGVEWSHERQSKDRRRAPRCRRDLLPVSACPVGLDGEWIQGWMRDCSPFGLTILLTQPVEAGTVLRLRWADGAQTVLALVEVKHARPQADSCTIGCELLTRHLPLEPALD